MTLSQYEEEVKRVNAQQYERLYERREIEMKSKQQEEFEELMQEYDNEIEAIAGQPDPGAELTYGEMQAVRKMQGKDYAVKNPESEPTMTKPYKKVVDKSVDNPSHYDFIDTTVEKFIEKGLNHSELMGWFKGNVIKYRLRAGKKNPIAAQDIAKADMYQEFYDDYVTKNTQ